MSDAQSRRDHFGVFFMEYIHFQCLLLADYTFTARHLAGFLLDYWMASAVRHSVVRTRVGFSSCQTADSVQQM